MIRRAEADDLRSIVALQQTAYAGNRAVMGVEPLPLRADYDEIFQRHECWIIGDAEPLDGVLILELRADDLLIWSVAAHPHARSAGVGNRLLAFAERRARETDRGTIRLYTSERLTRNIAWYTRRGFSVEWIEDMSDRRAVHMKKELEETT